MYIPVYLPRNGGIQLIFPSNEIDKAGLLVQNLLMLSKQEGRDIPPNITEAFKDASYSKQGLRLDFSRHYIEFALMVIESVIEVMEKDGEEVGPLKEFIEDVSVFERQYLQ